MDVVSECKKDERKGKEKRWGDKVWRGRWVTRGVGEETRGG